MPINKPYYQTARPFSGGFYMRSNHSDYTRHQKYAKTPQNFIQAYTLIRKDLITLFECVEPADQNLKTFSFRTYEILFRACTEVETNFKSILRANRYTLRPPENWSMTDYSRVNVSHYLDQYEVKVPYWKGAKSIRKPFGVWSGSTGRPTQPLNWYGAYNRAKHDRSDAIKLATFEHTVDAVCGLLVLLLFTILCK